MGRRYRHRRVGDRWKRKPHRPARSPPRRMGADWAASTTTVGGDIDRRYMITVTTLDPWPRRTGRAIASEADWWRRHSEGFWLRYLLLVFRLYPVLLLGAFLLSVVYFPWLLARDPEATTTVPVLGALAFGILTCSSVVVLGTFVFVSVIHGLTGLPYSGSLGVLVAAATDLLRATSTLVGRVAAAVLVCAPVAVVLLDQRATSVDGSSPVRLMASAQVGIGIVLVSLAWVYLASRAAASMLWYIPPMSAHLLAMGIPSLVAGFSAPLFVHAAAGTLDRWLPVDVDGIPRHELVAQFEGSLHHPNRFLCGAIVAVALVVVALVEHWWRARQGHNDRTASTAPPVVRSSGPAKSRRPRPDLWRRR